MAAVALLAAAIGAYTAPGLLQGLIEQKRREVERLRLQPDAREDGSWSLRLAYPASEASFILARSLGWRRERLAVLADLKRTSPGRKLGYTETVSETLAVPLAIDTAIEQGLAGTLVAIDKSCYGGAPQDLLDARHRADAAAETSGERLPIVAKDLIIDPLQIGRAASLGADAVLLIVGACVPDFPLLLDTCTIMGIEALVEVHTPDEVRLASDCGASLFLVNERDRATGELVPGQACALAPLLPPDAICLATGGVSTIEQVRDLRKAGYDGIVLGRAYPGTQGRELLREIGEEELQQRIVERIYTGKMWPNDEGGGDPSSEGESLFQP